MSRKIAYSCYGGVPALAELRQWPDSMNVSAAQRRNETVSTRDCCCDATTTMFVTSCGELPRLLEMYCHPPPGPAQTPYCRARSKPQIQALKASITTYLLQLPFAIVKGAYVTTLEPSINAVEVEGVLRVRSEVEIRTGVGSVHCTFPMRANILR